MFTSPLLFERMGWKGVASATPNFMLWAGVPFFAGCVVYNLVAGGFNKRITWLKISVVRMKALLGVLSLHTCLGLPFFTGGVVYNLVAGEFGKPRAVSMPAPGGGEACPTPAPAASTWAHNGSLNVARTVSLLLQATWRRRGRSL